MSQRRFETIGKKILERIDEYKFSQSSSFSFEKIVKALNKDFLKSVKGISIAPKFVDEISEKYIKNLNKYIKEFSEKSTVDLREKIRQNVIEGGRYEKVENRRYLPRLIL